MESEVVTLLEIQDLRAKVRELEQHSGVGELEEDAFGIVLADAVAALEERIGELVGRLSVPVRRRYQRMASHVERVMVPVIGGTCYGCFVSVPSATAGEVDPNAALQTCEHCGRFLYFLS
jgi:predicted  nucleic acid-binding Zn-ribbon protein